MGCKWRRQLTTPTHLAQELLKNVQCSAGSRSFAKETRALGMRSKVTGHQKLTTTNWEQSSKLILLQLHGNLPKNSMSTILWSFGIWRKLEMWKSSISGCVMSWLQIKKKKTSFWSVIFSYSTQQHTVSQSDCDVQQKMDFIWQWTMTSCWLYWEEAPKHFPKPNLHHTHTHTQRPWSLFGGLLLV